MSWPEAFAFVLSWAIPFVFIGFIIWMIEKD